MHKPHKALFSKWITWLVSESTQGLTFHGSNEINVSALRPTFHGLLQFMKLQYIYISLSYYVNGIASWNFDRFGFRVVTASASLKSQPSDIKWARDGLYLILLLCNLSHSSHINGWDCLSCQNTNFFYGKESGFKLWHESLETYCIQVECKKPNGSM